MSLFDLPKKNLSPVLFGPNEKMKPEVRLYIVQRLYNIFGVGNISGIYLLGSMAGRQYNETSDIDINVILRPGLDREVIKEYVKTFNGAPLPGTKHPVNFHVQNYVEPNFEDAEYAVYDIIANEWVVPPKKYEEIRNPYQEFKEEIDYAKMFRWVWKTAKNREELLKRLEALRKMVYSIGWGTPRELQQNILYKYVEHFLKNQNKK